MPITYGSQQNVTAAEIAFSIYSDVDNAFYDVLYPEHRWAAVMNTDQVQSNINPGAMNYAYMSRDYQGMASFIGQGPQSNIPMVGQSAGAVTVPIAYAAVGSEVTNEDARNYQYGFNGNLATDLGQIMRKAADNLIETTFFYGNSDLGFAPWMNYPGIETITAPNGSAGTSSWATKTPLEIFNDINNSLTYVWKNSRTLFMPSVIFLPLDKFSLLDQPMVIGTGTNTTALIENIRNYTIANATVPQLAGRTLEIVPIRYLDKADAAGTGPRMVIMDRNPQNQVLPMPMPFTTTPPVPAPLAAQFYAEFKVGSFHVRQKGSMLYVDGI